MAVGLPGLQVERQGAGGVKLDGAGYERPPRATILDMRDPVQRAANAVQQQASCIQAMRQESARNAAAFKAKMEGRGAGE